MGFIRADGVEISELTFNGGLVYKFKNIRGMTDFSDQFRKKINAFQTYWL